MKVVEIFNSIDGEGKRAGQLVTFIRLKGCNLNCPYCDTKYSWDSDKTEPMTMSYADLVDWVQDKGYPRVTLTGGEPLWGSLDQQGEVRLLLKELTKHGYQVNVETNGSIDIEPFRVADPSRLFFTVDYKCPSSCMEDKMCLEMFKELKAEDVLKFVVGDTHDLDVAKLVTRLIDPQCAVYVSPVFGKIEPSEIVEYMQKYKMNRWRIQLQLHKFIWDPNKRGV